MRTSSKIFFLSLAFTFLSALTAFAQPVFTLQNKKDACNGLQNGAFDINVSSGTGSISAFIFSSGSPIGPLTLTVGTPTTVPNLKGTAGGTSYLVVVSDDNGSNSTSTTIFLLSSVSVSLTSKSDVTTCSPVNGAIDITPSGGSGTYTYAWTGPSGFTATTQDLSNVGAGDYSVTVSDQGTVCTGSLGPITLNIASPSITLGSIPGVCSGTTSSALSYSATVGSPDKYNIDWDATANAAGLADVTLTNLPASPISISGIPSVVSTTTFNGLLYVTNSTNGCVSAANAISVTVTANVTPSVSISASPSSTICANQSVTFTATPTNGGASPSYQWKKNGSNVGSNSSTYTDATLANSDQISVVMTSNASCLTTPTATSNTITMTVTANVTPSVSIAAAPSNSICAGQSVTFTATPTNGGTPSYQWKKNGSNVGSNSATYIDAALANGDQISVVMTSSITCVTSPTATSNTITMTVTAIVTPSVSIAAAPGSTICAGSSVTFTATPTNGGATPSYQWKKNGSNVGSNSATYIDAALVNSDQISVVMTTSLTCVTSATATSNIITMTVNPAPTITPQAIPGVCSGTTTSTLPYSAVTGSPDKYSIDWDATANGAGLADVPNTALPTSPITVSGLPAVVATTTFNGLLYVTNSTTSCTSAGVAISVTVTANVTPSVSIASVPVSPICSGTSVTFTATPTNGGATPSYQWKKNGSNVGSNSSTYTDAALANGDQISVVMTTSLTCVTSATATSSTITMTVNTPVAPSVSIVAAPVSPICSGTSVTFTATPTNGGATPSYQWKKNGSNVGSNSSTYTDAALANGDQISVVMTTSLTCVTTATATSNTITMTVTTPLTPSVSIVSAPVSPICSGTSVTFTATPTNGGATPSYQWTKNGSNVGSNSSTYTDAALVNGDQIAVVMTTSLTCVTTPTATSNIITMTVTTPVTPSVSIVSAPVSPICSGTSVTFTATPTNGGATPSYQWKKNGSNVGSNSSTYTDAALANGDQISVVMTTSLTCVTSPTATSSTITMTVNSAVTPSVSISANPGIAICSGTSVMFTATPTNGGATPSYQWKKNGSNVGSNSATYTDAALANGDQISVVMTTSLTCVTSATATSNTLTMAVTPSVTPSVSIVSAPVSPICSGTSVTFTATPTNGGASPSYQWIKNGANVGSNSSTYIDAALANGDQVSVIMTSNASCTTTPTAASNTITMTVTTPVTPSVSISANPGSTICSGTSVTFTATPTNGGATPSYQWKKNGSNVGSNSATYTDASLANSDQISVVMTTSLTCVTSPSATSSTVTMTVNTVTFTSVKTDVTCNGGNDGKIVVTASGGNGVYSYSDDNGVTFQGGSTFSNLVAGTYKVEVKDGAGCTSAVSNISIIQPAAVTFSTSKTNVTCNSNNDGKIIVTASGGNGTYTYSDDNGATFQAGNTFTNLPPATYTILVKDGNGCTSASTPVTITEPLVVSFTFSTVDVTCNGGSTGKITVTASGGSGSGYVYSKDNGATFQASNVFNGLTAASYNVLVKDGNGCSSAMQMVTINEPAAVTFSEVSVDVSCNGGNDGKITVTASGGNGTFTYSKDNGVTFQPSNLFSNLTAATYNVIIKDGNGCLSGATPVTIIEPAAITFGTSKTDPTTCTPGNEGSVTVSSPSGGSGAGYTYSNDNGVSFQAGNSFATLTAGNYSIVVKDGAGCVSAASVVTLNSPGGVSFTTTQTNASCFGSSDGTITVTASGGNGTYSFSKDNGTTFTASGNPFVFNGLTAGTYQIVVKDGNNCQFSGSVVITEPAAMLTLTTAGTDVTCNGGTDGSITVTATGGTAPYQYALGIGAPGVTYQASNVFNSLPAGNLYQIDIKDVNGCVASTCCTTINQPLAVTFTSVNVDDTCNGGNDGSITVTASGGSGAGYTYSKDNGVTFQASNVLNGLTAATYQVIVKDGNGCLSVATPETISEPGAITFSAAKTDVTTCGGNDGTITVSSPAGGSGAGYTYSIDNGATFQGSGNFTALSAGNYNVVVKDGANCVSAATPLTIIAPGALSFTTTQTNVSCNGGNDGSITITPSGGSGTYTYSKDNGVTFSGSGSPFTFNTLTAASYQIVVKDGNGCQFSSLVAVTEPGVLSFTFSQVDVTCNGANDGTITVTASGGTSPYQYSKDGGATYQPGNTFSALAGGPYSIVVKDSKNCVTASSPATINQPGVLSFTISKVDATSCATSDGQIAVTASGGTTAYQYSIDNGTTYQAGNSFINLSPGSYSVVVKDANNCTTAASSVTINSPGGLTFTTAKTDVTCIGGTNGTITVTVSGGTGPYQYSSDNGTTFQVGNVFNALSPATYPVLVKDVNGCQFTSSVTIGQPAAVTFTFVKVDAACSGAPTGSITVTASGGNNLYTYSDDNGTTYQASNVFGGLAAQTYPVMVKDGNGCLSSATSVTINAGNLTPNFTKTDASSCGGSDGSIVVNSVTGGTAPYTYSKDNGATFQVSNTFSGLTAASYSLVVKDNTGCASATVSVSISQPPCGNGCFAFTSITHTDVRPTCTGNDDGQITINVSGGTQPYAVTLYDSITNPAAPKTFGPDIGIGAFVFGTLSPSLNYQYKVQDAAGNVCGGTVSLQIQTTVQATASGFVDAICYNQAVGQATVTVTSGGNSPYEYSLDAGTTWISFTSPVTITNLMPAATPYSILVRDGVGDLCPAQVSVTIGNLVADITIASSTANASCLNNDGSVQISSVNGGSGPYAFQFDAGATQNGVTSATYNGLSAGNHTLVITDGNSCVKSFPFVLTSPGYVDFNTLVTDPTCTGGGTDGKIDVTINTSGNFDVGITPDIINTPPNFIYTGISNTVTPVTFSSLSQGKYYIVVKPNGALCSTDSAKTISGGPSAVDFSFVTNNFVCSDSKGTIDISNIKGSSLVDYNFDIVDTLSVPNTITSGTLDQLQALGTVRLPLSQPGLDSGRYRIRLYQDQSASTGCVAPITSGYKTFSISGPTKVSFDMTVKQPLGNSKINLATGSITIDLQNTFAPPYELNLHMLASDIPGQTNDHNAFDAQWITLDNSTLPVEFVAKDLYAGLYQLSVIDKFGCERIDTLTITVDTEIMIPNIFTPNNDGKNDNFEILNLPPNSNIMIANRWGKEVYNKSNIAISTDVIDPNNLAITRTIIWNGGAESDGVYYYTLHTPTRTYTGWIELQR